MAGQATTWIAVPPDVVYAAVSDLPRMGAWSPENRGGEWLDPSRGAAVGAVFRGRNVSADREWETIVTVIEAEPAVGFAFRVAPPGQAGTTWRYTFVLEGSGTRVTETFEWRWTPVPDEGFRGRVGRMPLADAAAAVAERERHLQALVDATVTALKRELETGR